MELFAAVFRLQLPHTEHVILMIQTTIPLLVLWFTWVMQNDTKYRGTTLWGELIIWRVTYHIKLLNKTQLLKRHHWKGDTNVADMLPFKFHQEYVVQQVGKMAISRSWLDQIEHWWGDKRKTGWGRNRRFYLEIIWANSLQHFMNPLATRRTFMLSCSGVKRLGDRNGFWVLMDMD